jgi:hypothetical protein
MSFNKVVSSQLIKTVNAGGKPLTAKYATKTSTWERNYLSQTVQDDFCKALEKTSNVPAGATIAVLA